MRQNEREFDEERHPSGGSGSGSGPEGDKLRRLRREGEDFLEAGEQAIDRALSGDSQAFLDASRQRGGQ